MDTSLQSNEPGLHPVSQGPLYRQLANNLREAILHGEYGAGTKLPSERDLARQLDVSRTTAVAAYRLLREEGLIKSAQGSGTHVAASPRVGPAVPAADLPASKLLTESASEVLDMSSSVFPTLRIQLIEGDELKFLLKQHLDLDVVIGVGPASRRKKPNT